MDMDAHTHGATLSFGHAVVVFHLLHACCKESTPTFTQLKSMAHDAVYDKGSPCYATDHNKIRSAPLRAHTFHPGAIGHEGKAKHMSWSLTTTRSALLGKFFSCT